MAGLPSTETSCNVVVMRGIGQTLSRLPLALALIAGAMISVGHADVPDPQMAESGNGGGAGPRNAPWDSSFQQAPAEQAALPQVRVQRPGNAVNAPRPLEPSEAARVRRIFTLQAAGNLTAADSAIAELLDDQLLPSIQADRYLGPFHRATAAELTAWLAANPAHPDAPAIHALLTKRLPRGTQPPPVPAVVSLRTPAEPATLPEDAIPRDRGRSGEPLPDRRADEARVHFVHNRDAQAVRLALAVQRQNGADARSGEVAYVGGLAAWRQDWPEQARALFATAADAPLASPRLHAAAAFWAYRASRRVNDVLSALTWLRVAAEERRTLHGLLARRLLNLDTGIQPGNALLGPADMDAIAATPLGRLGFALLQVGQTDRAEAAFRALWPEIADNRSLGRSLLLVASGTGLTDFAAQIATLVQAMDGRPHDDLRFPVPRLRPAGGFRMDPTLVYALTRLESNFDPSVVSAAGARGLMQIMPVTAGYVAGDADLDPDRLRNPALNLDLGQRYVVYLSRQEGIGEDLLRVLASYNSGPGGFQRWSGDLHDDGDPLLFIEAIPTDETRAFVAHVLTYSWIYAARLHLPATSLDELAAGEFPRFTPALGAGKVAATTSH